MSEYHPIPYQDDHAIQRGFTLLEASAGTGKTYSLTFLYLRLLLEEQLRPQEIVVVTFTNAAAAELRDRIHQRIADAIAVADPDQTVDHIAQSEQEAMQRIIDRAHQKYAQNDDDFDVLHTLNEASATLDTSVISTIHSFAGRLGEEFSTITGTPSGAELVDNLHDILDEVLLDLEHQLAEEYPDAARLLVQNGQSTHTFIERIAKTLLNNPDVSAPPDALLYLIAQDFLDTPKAPYSTPEEYQAFITSFVATLREFTTWMRSEGKAQWQAWFDAIRDAGTFPKRSINPKSVQKAFDTLDEIHQLVSLGRNDALIAASVLPKLKVGDLNKCALRFFCHTYLAERHKSADGAISDQPDANELPASSVKVDEIYDAAVWVERDIFTYIWAYRVAQKAVRVTTERAAARGLRSHAQIISDVERALQGEQRQELVDAVQKRYSAALIDEFQDTDLLQWHIFEALFSSDHAITYLIGDPKQAIYGFRGANVAVYQHVRQKHLHADRIMSLGTNYRSDRDYNVAINRVFDEESTAKLDGFIQVKSPERSPERRLDVQDIAWPETISDRLVQVTGESPNDALVTRYICDLKTSAFSQYCSDMIAHEIATRLNEGDRHQIHDGDRGWRALEPRDCAVLVRFNKDAQTVVKSLQRAGIPAVLRDKQSAALSDAADALMHWLHALSQPGNSRAIRTFLFSPLVRMPMNVLDALDDHELSAWADFFGELRSEWYRSGLHAALRRTLHRPLHPYTDDASEEPTLDVMSNLLARSDGLRVAGDLMHLAEVLHAAQRDQRLSVDGLLSWFARARYDETHQATENPLFKRRIASDDEAVQVVTGHSAKGLEYPLVWMFGFTKGAPRPSFLIHPEQPTQRFAITTEIYYLLKRHAEEEQEKADKTVLSKVQIDRLETLLYAQHPSLQALSSPQDTAEPRDECTFDLGAAVQASHDYAADEDQRLLYVGLTRARLRTVIFINARHRADWRDSEPTFELAANKKTLCEDIEADASGIGSLQRNTPWPHGTLRIEQWKTPPAEPLDLPTYQPSSLDLHHKIRTREAPPVEHTRHQRPSFSSLVHLLPDHFAYFDVDEEPDRLDEEGVDSSQDFLDARHPDAHVDKEDEESRTLPLSRYASGREAGTALHTVFENIDFEGARDTPCSDAYLDTVRDEARRALIGNGLDPEGQDHLLAKGVITALQTPFGGVLKDFRLAELSAPHRIDEMQFLMPVGGREHHTTARAMFAALRQRQGDGIIDDAWFQDLSVGMLQSLDLHGMMIGFIDLVFRAEVDGRMQYFVADYKSNRMAPQSEAITAAHFSQDALQNEMRQHHYYLQYHLYLVALHRWLKARLTDYDYDTHIGGAYYLFVRGMDGPPQDENHALGRGVFYDRPPKSVILALDAALRSPDLAPTPEEVRA